MPGPLQLLLDPVSLTVFALYGGILLWERLAPARALPHVRGWRTRGVVGFVAYFFVSSYLPLLWNDWLAAYRLLDLTALGTIWGAVTGLVVYEAGVYVWHRAMHASSLLWRVFHQMHHSAERVDAYGAFWFSPFDMIGWTALFSLCLVVVAGITPEATVLVVYVTTFLSVFQHANLRTPRWLGFIVQRPESHSAHHERGVHARNYSDLPIFDVVFGTFHNPREFSARAGFYDGASARVAEMVGFRDVSQPPVRAAHTGSAVA
jgi:sterol desaturase/sphingolipid hydroxylase (fatty acid hydroxylase superfamily)